MYVPAESKVMEHSALYVRTCRYSTSVYVGNQSISYLNDWII